MNEEVNRWLIFAQEDLQVAEILWDAGIHNQVCFHAQQCVEKALKGTLIRRGHVPPRTHSITDLLSLFPPEWLADLRDDLSMMDDLYIPTRYPDALPGVFPDGLPGRAEAEEALALARAVLNRLIGD